MFWCIHEYKHALECTHHNIITFRSGYTCCIKHWSCLWSEIIQTLLLALGAPSTWLSSTGHGSICSCLTAGWYHQQPFPNSAARFLLPGNQVPYFKVPQERALVGLCLSFRAWLHWTKQPLVPSASQRTGLHPFYRSSSSLRFPSRLSAPPSGASYSGVSAAQYHTQGRNEHGRAAVPLTPISSSGYLLSSRPAGH